MNAASRMDQGLVFDGCEVKRLSDKPKRVDYATAAHNMLIYSDLARALQALDAARCACHRPEGRCAGAYGVPKHCGSADERRRSDAPRPGS